MRRIRSMIGNSTPAAILGHLSEGRLNWLPVLTGPLHWLYRRHADPGFAGGLIAAPETEGRGQAVIKPPETRLRWSERVQ